MTIDQVAEVNVVLFAIQNTHFPSIRPQTKFGPNLYIMEVIWTIRKNI